MGHLDHRIVCLQCRRIRSQTPAHGDVVRFALCRQHGHDVLRLARRDVGGDEVTRIRQQHLDLPEHLRKGFDLGIWPARRLALIALALALVALGLVLLRPHGVARARTLLDLGLGLRYPGQSLVAPGDLCRHVQPVIDKPAVTVFSQLEQLLHFFAQLRFDLVGVLLRQGFVPAAPPADQRHDGAL